MCRARPTHLQVLTMKFWLRSASSSASSSPADRSLKLLNRSTAAKNSRTTLRQEEISFKIN